MLVGMICCLHFSLSQLLHLAHTSCRQCLLMTLPSVDLSGAAPL